MQPTNTKSISIKILRWSRHGEHILYLSDAKKLGCQALRIIAYRRWIEKLAVVVAWLIHDRQAPTEDQRAVDGPTLVCEQKAARIRLLIQANLKGA